MYILAGNLASKERLPGCLPLQLGWPCDDALSNNTEVGGINIFEERASISDHVSFNANLCSNNRCFYYGSQSV